MINQAVKKIACLAAMLTPLTGCIQQPVFKTTEHALVRSNYPIVAINGVETEKAYRLDIEAGENTVVVLYDTYQYDYFCTFSWLAKPGTVYEFIDQESQYPVTLYRWYRKNSLWAIRLEPVDPLACAQKPREF